MKVRLIADKELERKLSNTNIMDTDSSLNCLPEEDQSVSFNYPGGLEGRTNKNNDVDTIYSGSDENSNNKD